MKSLLKIKSLLGCADILKINEDELAFLADYFEIENGYKSQVDPVKVFCDFMVAPYPVEIICITLGSSICCDSARRDAKI